MKNIAIFIPTIKSGGAEKQATLLAATLAQDCQVHFISFHGKKYASESNLNRLIHSDIRLHFLEGGTISKLKKLHQILKSNHIDYVFNYLTYCDVVGAFVERLAGVGNIYNGIRNSRLPYLKYLAEKIAHNYLVKGTVYNCYSGAEFFKGKGFRVEKNIVIPNCFAPISNEIHRKDKDIKHIITVGRFVEQKDYLTALKVIADLKSKRTDFKFDIVGYGELEQQIRTWIAELNISEFIDIHINPNNIPELLERADIYLSTSLFEGTSNSMMEALNYSLPVVATNVGDNSHLVDDCQTGFLTRIADVETLSAALTNLLDSYQQRIDMGLRGHSKLQQEFSQSIFRDRYKNLLND